MPSSRSRRGRIAVIVGLIMVLLAGTVGPTDLWPNWWAAEQVDPSQLAPDQRWGSAAGQNHETEGEGTSPNRAMPRSELAKYPQPNFPKEEKPPANAVREVAAPSGFKGFDEKSSKENAGERGANSRTFDNADGTQTTEFSESPLNYRRPDGSWHPIDTELVPDGSGWRNRADQVDSRFNLTASESPFVTVRLSDEHEMSFGLTGTTASQAKADGSTITYPGVTRDTDLRIDVVPGGVKETLVLRSADAAHSWVFPLRFKGLTAKVVDGRVALVDGEGKEKGQIPAGFMVDSADAKSTSLGVRYELVPHAGGQALKISLDSAWLRDPARKFPVLVDPSVHGPIASDAMYTSGGSHIRTSELHIGNGNVSYLKFSDANGPAAKLPKHKIFAAQLYLTNFDAPSCHPEPVSVHAVTAPWPSSGHPATGGALTTDSFAYGHIAFGQEHSACPTQSRAIDLGDAGRDLVQRWVNGQDDHGLAVKAVRSSKTFTGRGTANPPRLYVTHTPYNASYRIERGVPEPPVHRTSDNEEQKPTVRIAVTNRGSQTWTPGAYKLSYRAFTSAGQPKDAREAAALPRDVPPGDTVTVDARVFSMEPGDYLLDFSMVHNNTFFTDEQIPPARLTLTVFEVPPIVKGQYPPAGHTAPTLTPQLWAEAVDKDAPPNTTVDYEFEVCNTKVDGSPDEAACTLSPRSKSRTSTVPKGRLQWSERYYWRAWAIDPSNTRSLPLPFSALLTAVPQPDVLSHLGGAPYSAGGLDFDPQVGNYTTSAVDAAIGVTGPELTVARTYNSLDPRKDGVFGAGWSTRYDMRVIPDLDGSGNVVVTYPDGQQVRFGRNAEDGSFDPPPGRAATFYQDVTGTQNFVLVDKSNTVYTFRSFDGKLMSIVDNAGRMVELDYGVTGLLKRAISRTSNRYLYFTWTGNHVTEVRTDPPVTGGLPIKWRYEYFGDRLTKACDPKNGCTTYDYEIGSHYRSMVMDAKPDSYWRLGELEGDHAVSQVATNLSKDWGWHQNTTRNVAGPLAASPDKAVGFNGTTSLVKLPDGAIKKSRDLSVELWFRTTSGGPLIGFQHKPFDQDPIGAVPVLYVDKDGKLRGQYWHGRVAPITSAGAVNDGNWHHVVLSGSLAIQTLFLDGVKVGTTDGEIDDSLLHFGQIGAAHAVGPADWAPYGWWPGEGKKHFAGDIDEVAIYQHPLGEEAARAHFNARNHADQLTKVTMPSGRVAAQLTYDTLNDRIQDYTDEHGGAWKLGLPQVSGTETKTPDGRPIRNLVRSIEVTDPGKRSHFFDYDPIKGRIIRFVAPLGVGVRHEDRADPSVVPTTPTTAPPCTSNPPPNPDGSPIYCGGQGTNNPNWIGGPVQGVGVRSYDYDESGFQHLITDENGHQVTLQHDDRGNVLSRKTCRSSSLCDTEHFTYHKPDPGKVNDTDPRIDKQLTARDARSSGPSDPAYLTTSLYTARGDLQKQTMPDGSTVEHVYTDGTEAAQGGGNPPAGLLESTKDARGNWTQYKYFANGDLFSTTEPPAATGGTGLVTEYGYDLLGRKTSEKEISDAYPAGLESKFVYDERNRVAEVTGVAATNAVTNVKHTPKTKTTFNADGQPEKVEVSDLTGGDPTRTTSYTYDDRGRHESVTDPEGAKTSYAYDAFGNRTSVTNPNGTRIEYAYTARNKIAEVRLRGWHGKPVSGGVNPDETPATGQLLVLESYTYDLGGRLVWQFDAMGRKTMYDYTQNGLVSRVRAELRDPTRIVTLEENTFDAAGNLATRKGPGGRLTQYVVDAMGRAKETIADPAGLARKTLYSYNSNGDVAQIVRSGKGSNTGAVNTATSEVVDYTYDNAGNQLTESIKYGTQQLTTTRSYDRRGLLVSETDPRGKVTDFGYDEYQRQVRVTAPEVSVETNGGTPSSVRPVKTVGYDSFGRPVAIRDENGHVAKSFYDKAGRVVRTETPDYTAPGAPSPIKGVSSVKYDAAGNVIERTDPRGAVSRFRYDQLGRMVERQDPKADSPTEVGGVWKYTYTHKGEQLSVTDPTGARTEATYDDLGRMVTTSVLERKPVSAAFTSSYEYNDAGDLVKTTAPNNDLSTFTYDALGQRITATDAANVTTKLGYDGAGRPVWQQDALGRTNFTRHDVAGRVTGQFSLDGQGQILRRSTYTHDAVGNVETFTDPLNRVKRFTYDALGRLTQQVEPVSDTESITTSFGYDAMGNRTRFTDGRQNKFVYTYNSWSMPESVIEPSTTAHPNAADRTWTSVYDVAGQVSRMVAPGNVTRDRQYDYLGRMTRETGAGAEQATLEHTRAYDTAGRVTAFDAPGATNVFDRNDRGGLLSATGPSGNSSFEYDSLGRVTTRTDAAGTARFTYDKGRLHTVSDGITGVSQAMTYNEAGQLKKVQYGAGRTRDFDFDTLGRPKSDTVKDSGGATISSISYELDNNDQLTRKVTTGYAGAGDNTYTYDHAGRMTSWTVGGTKTDYAWDANGNRTRNGAKTAVYDERNRVQSDGDYTYKYTPRGTTSSRTSSGLEEKFSFDAFDRMIEAGTTRYTYDGLDRLVSRNTKQFSYAGAEIDAVSDSDSLFGRGASGELLSVSQGADKRVALSDRHGDLVGAFDPASSTGLQESVTYDPFGKVTASAGPRRSVGFQGDWTDPDTGDVNMGARWYAPGTSAFRSRDDIELPFTPSVKANRYLYTRGSPLNFIDYDGHDDGWGVLPQPDENTFKCSNAQCEANNEKTMIFAWEMTPFSDAINMYHDPSWANFGWLASNIPGGKIFKLPKIMKKLDNVSALKKVPGGGLFSALGKKLDEFANLMRRGLNGFGNLFKGMWDKLKGLFKAGIPPGLLDAWRAAQAAVTAQAKAAAAYAAKHNPLPILKSALTPKIAMKDLVSSTPNLPARQVSDVAENVQDVNKTYDTIKATVIKPGTEVIQTVAEQAVSDFANSQIPGLGDALGMFGPGRKRGNGSAKDAGDSSRAQAGGSCPISYAPHSFDGDTPVLLADGSRKPIKEVREDDEVVATNPTTGETSVRKVTNVRSHRAEGALFEIAVDSGGKITATDEHQFWVPDFGRWVFAKDLKPGYTFTTADHRPATVTGTRSFHDHRRVYNLTVDVVHTYYVVVGVATVLTHNADPKKAGPHCPRIDPFRVRFSQDSANWHYSDRPGTIGDTVRELLDGTTSPASIPPIGLVRLDSGLWSIDNRRLVTFQMANMPIPFYMATSRRDMERFQEHVTTKTNGIGIEVILEGDRKNKIKTRWWDGTPGSSW